MNRRLAQDLANQHLVELRQQAQAQRVARDAQHAQRADTSRVITSVRSRLNKAILQRPKKSAGRPRHFAS